MSFATWRKHHVCHFQSNFSLLVFHRPSNYYVYNETVSVKAFKKWPFASHFEAEVDEENRISSLKCVICSD